MTEPDSDYMPKVGECFYTQARLEFDQSYRDDVLRAVAVDDRIVIVEFLTRPSHHRRSLSLLNWKFFPACDEIVQALTLPTNPLGD